MEAAVAKAVKNVSKGNFFNKGEYVLGSSQRSDAKNHNNPNAPEGFLNRVPSLDLGDDVTELVSVDCEPSISGKARAKFRKKRRDKEFKFKKTVASFTVSKEQMLERVEVLS